MLRVIVIFLKMSSLDTKYRSSQKIHFMYEYIFIYMNSGDQAVALCMARTLRVVRIHSPSSSLQEITNCHHYRQQVSCSDDYRLPQCMTSKFGRCLSKYECALESVSHIRESFIKHFMAAKRLRTDHCFRGCTLQLYAD